VVKFKNWLVVPKSDELRKKILDEAHNSKISIHPGSNKMYHDLRHLYWWPNIKWDIIKYIVVCDICGRVKADHLHASSFLQPLHVPVWKWEDISIDFIVGLAIQQKGMILFGSLWIVSLSLLNSCQQIQGIQPRSM
jgi:hypothetical protein